MSKFSKGFKECIKQYLDQHAIEDKLFAETYKKENKSIDECCNYVMKCAKDGGAAGYSDEEVFGWAVHYYDEDDIKNITPISGRVVVNHSVELSEEDKAAAKEKAMELAIQEAKEEANKNLAETVELSEEDMAEVKAKVFEKVVSEKKEKLLQKKANKKTDPVEEVPSLFDM